jgi:amino acid transporter
MRAYRVLWLNICVSLGVVGALVAFAVSPAVVAFLFIASGVIGSLLTMCLVSRYSERGGRGGWLRRTFGRWLRSLPTPSPAQLDAVACAFGYASPESAHLRAPGLRALTDEQVCKRWRTSYRASERQQWSAVELIVAVAERQTYLDELERRNRHGFAAWLAASPEAAEDPLPYFIGNRVDSPAVDWDELTRGPG